MKWGRIMEIEDMVERYRIGITEASRKHPKCYDVKVEKSQRKKKSKRSERRRYAQAIREA